MPTQIHFTHETLAVPQTTLRDFVTLYQELRNLVGVEGECRCKGEIHLQCKVRAILDANPAIRDLKL